MIEVPVLKEIRSYEAKLVGPLSFRGLVCGAIGIACAYLVYMFQKIVLGMETPIGGACMAAAAPALSFWLIKPYGLKLEVYLKTVFVDMFLAPKVRISESTFNYEFLLAEGKKLGIFEEEEEEEDGEEKGKKTKTKATSTKNLPPELRAYK